MGVLAGFIMADRGTWQMGWGGQPARKPFQVAMSNFTYLQYLPERIAAAGTQSNKGTRACRLAVIKGEASGSGQ